MHCNDACVLDLCTPVQNDLTDQGGILCLNVHGYCDASNVCSCKEFSRCIFQISSL